MVSKNMITTVTLNNGIQIPQFGLRMGKAKPEIVQKAVENAISQGYRMIDGDYVYFNENAVGAGIRNKIEEGVVKREDLFVTSKLTGTFHRPDLVKVAIKKTLADLGLYYLDLYLMHSRCSFKEGDEIVAAGPDGQPISFDVNYLDTWKAMEALVAEGLTKSIGVSNCNEHQIRTLLKHTSIKPVVIQVDGHPCVNRKVEKVCEAEGIKIMGYSPFDSMPLVDPVILKIAKKHGKSAAQIILRWNIQRGIIVIPKSVSTSQLAEYMDIFDFELSGDEMKAINTHSKNNNRTTPQFKIARIIRTAITPRLKNAGIFLTKKTKPKNTRIIHTAITPQLKTPKVFRTAATPQLKTPRILRTAIIPHHNSKMLNC